MQQFLFDQPYLHLHLDLHYFIKILFFITSSRCLLCAETVASSALHQCSLFCGTLRYKVRYCIDSTRSEFESHRGVPLEGNRCFQSKQNLFLPDFQVKRLVTQIPSTNPVDNKFLELASQYEDAPSFPYSPSRTPQWNGTSVMHYR